VDICIGNIAVVRHDSGWVSLVDRSTGVELRYDAEEWEAFVAGVKDNEFTLQLSPGK